MKFQDDISNMNTHTHTHTHTHGQAETNMSPLFQSWGHNKGNDQVRSNRAANQCICFRYIHVDSSAFASILVFPQL